MSNKKQTAMQEVLGELQIRLLKIKSEPNGLTRETMISNFLIDSDRFLEMERHLRIRAYEQGIMDTRKIMAFENKTIAQALDIKEFPYLIFDKNGNIIYEENENECWEKMKYNSENKRIFSENHLGDFWGKKFDAEGNRIENHKS